MVVVESSLLLLLFLCCCVYVVVVVFVRVVEESRSSVEVGKTQVTPSCPCNTSSIHSYLNSCQKKIHLQSQMDEIRAVEFARIGNEIYVDHAGATLYSERHVLEATADLVSGVYGNPHSSGAASAKTLEAVKDVRKLVLGHFCVSATTHDCIFTSGATASLKLIGESFPFTLGSKFKYAANCHNSVCGIREYASRNGATCIPVETNISGETSVFFDKIVSEEEKEDIQPFSLTCVPAECNWSGTKYDMGPFKNCRMASANDYILIDASKFVGLDRLDLSHYPGIDFVVLSFYKMFGYPTGLGCIIAKRNATNLLITNRTYFGGGTVLDAGREGAGSHKYKKDFNALEDGTINFLGILALKRGFQLFERIQFSLNTCARDHAFMLSQKLYFELKKLVHKNSERPVCLLYSKNHELRDPTKQGPVVTFNIQFPDGNFVGHSMVLAALTRSNIQARSGCFCSPGGCSSFMGLDKMEIQDQYKKGHSCGGSLDLIDGKPTGACRISFSWMNTEQEVDTILAVLKRSFMGIVSDRESEGNMEIAPTNSSSENSLEIPGVVLTGKSKMINHLVNSAKEGVRALEAVTRPKFSVGSLVGTVFDSEDVAKITKIEGNCYTLLFDDGFEMLGITADQLVELSS